MTSGMSGHDTVRGMRDSPPSRRRGGRDVKKKTAKHPLKGADGVVVSRHRLFGSNASGNRWLEQPPRLRQLRNGSIFFMAQPPLLREGGDFAIPGFRAAFFAAILLLLCNVVVFAQIDEAKQAIERGDLVRAVNILSET